ncbi:hypothetical protein [Saccharothrix yanglingensis]|uniref:Uncharacterized protein n=1 Tax=Saccharothrix yanglingensis TaxID=659496 RepID=A0ABU0WU25_9PSEU|nr:hypothetical protein [Saccharothrix yanglingensis]MDQ2583342.1 hypothetical protein [Saccharothrix yanglingensis]
MTTPDLTLVSTDGPEPLQAIHATAFQTAWDELTAAGWAVAGSAYREDGTDSDVTFEYDLRTDAGGDLSMLFSIDHRGAHTVSLRFAVPERVRLSEGSVATLHRATAAVTAAVRSAGLPVSPAGGA